MKTARCAAIIETPLGELLMTETPDGVSGLFFRGQRHEPAWEDTPPAAPARWEAQMRAWLRAYFDGTRLPAPPPLSFTHGTALQHAVWQALLEIPRAATSTYGEIARRLGLPRAARAVGAAIGRNPLSILVPCHRVVGSSGSLTGYAGGLRRKQWLLEHEGALKA